MSLKGVASKCSVLGGLRSGVQNLGVLTPIAKERGRDWKSARGEIENVTYSDGAEQSYEHAMVDQMFSGVGYRLVAP
jgi:hypothetical protein